MKSVEVETTNTGARLRFFVRLLLYLLIFGSLVYVQATFSGDFNLEGLDVLILDCLRASRHPTHFSLDEALAVARRVNARRTLLVHMSHDICHADVASTLPAGVELAYDGLMVPLAK